MSEKNAKLASIISIIILLLLLISPFAYRIIRVTYISLSYPMSNEVNEVIEEVTQKAIALKDVTICNELPEEIKYWTGDNDDPPFPIEARPKCIEEVIAKSNSL